MTNMPEPGCYFDSHWGHYIVPQIIGLAQGYGRPTSGTVRDLLARYDRESHLDTYPNEYLIDESDRAVDWLNEHVCPDGYTWEWDDGDFGLYALDTDED